MLKLNVGFNRKTGEANYGSRGASVELEVEVEAVLVGDAERLKERIRGLFKLARASVDEELAKQLPNGLEANGNGTSNGNGHTNGQHRDQTRPATASQVRALNAIADRRQLDLAGILVERFNTRDPAELKITEASALIDELKTASGGTGGRR